MPFEEHDISISLHTPYQVTKLLGELYTNYFHNLYDLPIANARFFNVFGPGEVPGKYRNVIPNFMHWSMNGRPLPITGDGTETRDWDVKNRLLSSINKAQKLLDYKPKMEFKDGLKKVHGWFVENQENINRSAEF